MDEQDRAFMLKAIREAAKCKFEEGQVNPKVGAVVVKNNFILAYAHRGEIEPGEHAEFTALEKKLGEAVLAGATVYTTLEPCTTRNHPKIPCAELLIERKVARVVIGMLDPNQEICGKGMRRLREANIETDVFPHDLMAQVEEQSRKFVREQQRVSLLKLSQKLNQGIEAAGLTAFIPSRRYYAILRPDVPSIDRYIATAKNSLILISINLMTGVRYDDFCSILEPKLEDRNNVFTATVSVLDPRRNELLAAIAPIFRMNPGDLHEQILKTVQDLSEFKGRLSATAQERFTVKVHKAMPFGSVIMLDHREETGRIQIETKPYKASIGKSFGFEVVPSGASGLYKVLADSFEDLLRDGETLGPEGLS